MDIATRGCALALAGGFLLVMTAPSHAQPAPATITCTDADGRPVRAVQVANGIMAKATTDTEGRRVIEYDARKVEGINAQQQLFVYAHECGHHALGHDASQPLTAAQEHDADCHGVQTLMRRAGLTSNDVMILQADMGNLSTGVARRLPWRPRVYDLEGCLPEVIARRQPAGPVSPTANDCVIHNDAENAILNASRDGLTVDGAYLAGNRCPRDLTCTFTIEVGTLPDADADAGSWRNFRAQKIISEQHTIPGQAAHIEFRFRASVNAVPAGESVDFHVVPACR